VRPKNCQWIHGISLSLKSFIGFLINLVKKNHYFVTLLYVFIKNACFKKKFEGHFGAFFGRLLKRIIIMAFSFWAVATKTKKNRKIFAKRKIPGFSSKLIFYCFCFYFVLSLPSKKVPTTSAAVGCFNVTSSNNNFCRIKKVRKQNMLIKVFNVNVFVALFNLVNNFSIIICDF
jgi:hypothetical protein